MSNRALRTTRLLTVAALACLGLALFAQSALASYSRIQVAKINQGGNPSDTFAFHPTFTWGPGTQMTIPVPSHPDFSLAGGQTSQDRQTILGVRFRRVQLNLNEPRQAHGPAQLWRGILGLAVRRLFGTHDQVRARQSRARSFSVASARHGLVGSFQTSINAAVYQPGVMLR